MTWYNSLLIILGSAIIGFGLNYFNMANELVEGGLTGVTLLLKYLFSFEPAFMILLLNLPLFFISYKVLGKNVFYNTLLGTISVSIFLWLFRDLRLPLGDDLLLASLYAGVTAGIGYGLVFRFGGTTGGTDVIARLCQKYFGWSIGKTLFAFDLVVLTLSLIYLDYKIAMYTIVAVFVGARVIDFVLEGAYAAKATIIISDAAMQIADKIMQEMERGATLLNGRGGYTASQKDVLYCVVSRNELIRLKNIVKSVDPFAFITVHDVRDVLGEGFSRDEN